MPPPSELQPIVSGFRGLPALDGDLGDQPPQPGLEFLLLLLLYLPLLRRGCGATNSSSC